MENYIAYYRVSTARQGRSGLGLEGQRAAVTHFAQGQGLLRHAYTEVESGARNARPQLLLALEQARRLDYVLLIAKLDRLSRDVGFIFALRNSGVRFQACDIPEANTLTIGIFAVMAQHERELISRRIKDALAAKRARGEPLGQVQNFTPEARTRGRATAHAHRSEHPQRRQLARLVGLLRDKNQTLQQIADELNAHAYRTARGALFTPTAVWRLLPSPAAQDN